MQPVLFDRINEVGQFGEAAFVAHRIQFVAQHIYMRIRNGVDGLAGFGIQRGIRAAAGSEQQQEQQGALATGSRVVCHESGKFGAKIGKSYLTFPVYFSM